MNKDLDILKAILLEAEEDEKATEDKEKEVKKDNAEEKADDRANEKEDKPDSPFDKDPMGFILKKYHTLNALLEELMTPAFKEYVTAIFIQSPKPTSFKIVLHNSQYFYLSYMGDGTYLAIIAGKRHYLSSIGEKERAMKGISRLLQQGSPLKTKGPEGAEQGTREDGEDDGSLSGGNNNGGGDQTGVENTPAAEEGGEDENEPLTEAAILRGILTEADTGDAVLFESALVYAWYKITGLPMPKDAILPAELSKLKSNKNMVNKAIEAVKKLNLGTGKSARATGRTGEKATLTDFWKKQGASNTTPKTDVILGNKKISVKAGNSQLMSGGKNESLATFYAAAKKVPGILKTKEAQDVIKTFEKFVEGGYTKAGSVEKELTAGKNKVLKDGDKAHKEMKTKLQDLFNKSPKFKIAFAKEAMSGYEKFGPKSPASADYVLSVDSGFGSPKLHSTQNDSYAAKIADQMNLTVRFKSTSQKIGGEKTGKYRFWSVVSLISDPTKLKEGISDTIKNAYNSVKNFINQGIYSLTKFVMGDDEIDVELNNTIDFS